MKIKAIIIFHVPEGTKTELGNLKGHEYYIPTIKAFKKVHPDCDYYLIDDPTCNEIKTEVFFNPYL